MSSAALLDQDLGSDSEDDNFNPAPAVESDNDAAGNSDDDEGAIPRVNGDQDQRRPSKQRVGDEQVDGTRVLSERANGRGAAVNGSGEPKEEDDEDAEPKRLGGLDGAAEDDDEDEEEEDEEDEEEAISVEPQLQTVLDSVLRNS